ncbi:hypothetical protein N9B39_01740 [bacterium]|nr:hypothetical protein [bacterium]
MSNPYVAPSHISPTKTFGQAKHPNEIKAPAVALMVVSIIGLSLGTLGLIADVFFLTRLGDVSLQLIVRSIWGVILVISSTFILIGAIKMKNMTNYGVAKAAAIVAIIPFVGPCCLLGIPFGIWAVVVLSKPHVRDAFR